MHSASVEVQLCKICLNRERIRARPAKKCLLCDNLFERLDDISREILDKLSEYEYSTFLVGTIFPQDVLDKEDELRSRLKVKGRESVKSQFTSILTKQLSSSSKSRVDYSLPDLTILYSVSDRTFSINSRSIWLSARYVKRTRRLSQRSLDCKTCNGLGCAECDYRGKSANSIQSIATDFFCRKFKAQQCNFVWLGSEDQKSLVSGSGRPFYVEVVQPKIRLAYGESQARMFFTSEDLKIFKVKRMDRRIREVPHFDLKCIVYLMRDSEDMSTHPMIDQIERDFTGTTVNVQLSKRSRTVTRQIYSIMGKELDGRRAVLLIRCEGGIPIKKFVGGQDGSVQPNISSLISPYQLDPDKPFDILDIKLRTPRQTRIENQPSTKKSLAESPEDIE